MAPCLAYMLVMYVTPALIMLYSPFQNGVGSGIASLGEALVEPSYQRVMMTTFRTALVVTVVAVLLGYPTAYYLSRLPSEKVGKYMLLIMFPLWTSLLVRTYAWIALLQDAGVINSTLMSTNLISNPVRLLYNSGSVAIGMVQILLPYAIVTMYSVMVGIKPRLSQTAQVLGASPVRAFWHVFFPLSLPGLSAACLLLFIMGLGFFVTPALLGGRRDMMVGTLIQQQVVLLGDWNSASLLSIMLLAATIILLFVYSRFARLENLVPASS
ncbi:ABC transporter permease [Microvirga vignae]|nr:ABC transporter permease [Microvirga vignae]